MNVFAGIQFSELKTIPDFSRPKLSKTNFGFSFGSSESNKIEIDLETWNDEDDLI